MAATVVEQQISRSTSGPFGQLTGVREFIVYDTVDPIYSPAVIIDSLFGTPTTPDAMPGWGSQFPDISGLFAETHDIAKVTGHADMWRVIWNYEMPLNGGVGDPNSIGFVEFNLEQGRSFMPAWREGNLWLANGGNPNPSTFTNIGGTPVDSGGEPGTAPRLQQILEISEIMTGTPNWAAIRQAVGARNSESFYGGDPGSVVLLPVTSARIGTNKFRVNFRFAHDEFYHMEQRPVRDVNNGIQKFGLPGSGTPDGLESCALRVYWFQPFRRTYNFNTLSNNW